MEWYPWHYRRYREKTLHLTAEQDGIYRRLIDHYMETRKPLPDNNVALARIAGVDLACFEHASSILRAFFVQEKGGILSHKTCNEMLDEQDKQAKFRSERATKAALARHKKDNEINENHATSNAMSMPEAMLEHATVNSKQISSKEDIPPLPPKATKLLLFDQFWQEYPRQRRGSKDKALIAYRSAIKRGNTEQQILTGVKNYAASSDVARGFAKGCAAWLNDDGFANQYQPVGVQGGRPAGGNRGFDALAVAAAKISQDVDREAERLRRENPVLYFQRLADQSAGGNHIAGSLDAPDTGQHDAPPARIGHSQESGSD